MVAKHNTYILAHLYGEYKRALGTLENERIPSVHLQQEGELAAKIKKAGTTRYWKVDICPRGLDLASLAFVMHVLRYLRGQPLDFTCGTLTEGCLVHFGEFTVEGNLKLF